MHFQNGSFLPYEHKILHNTYIHGKPDYLAELVHPLHSLTIRLRSTNTHQLQLPDKYKLHSTNIRVWSISIPYFWNNLPLVKCSVTITSIFKSLLKTHLCQQAYPAMPKFVSQLQLLYIVTIRLWYPWYFLILILIDIFIYIFVTLTNDCSGTISH